MGNLLVIRLQRAGRKKNPFYRIVVAEKSAPVKGRFVERVGHYNPLSTPKTVVLKTERIEHWISVGATPSDTVARLVAKNGISAAEKFISKRVMKPSKADLEAKQKAEEEAAAKAEAEKVAAEAKKAEAEAVAADEAAPETPSEGESEKEAAKPAPEAEAPKGEGEAGEKDQ